MDELEINRKPLFTAPIDMEGGDEIVLLFGKPVLIKRHGVEIWRDSDLPDYVFKALIDTKAF